METMNVDIWPRFKKGLWRWCCFEHTFESTFQRTISIFRQPYDENLLGMLEVISNFNPSFFFFLIGGDSTLDVIQCVWQDDIHYTLCITSWLHHSVLPSLCHSVEWISQSVDSVLLDIGIVCNNNTASITGIYSGLQAHIKKMNTLTDWVSCCKCWFRRWNPNLEYHYIIPFSVALLFKRLSQCVCLFYIKIPSMHFHMELN